MINLIKCIHYLIKGWWKGVNHRPESLEFAQSHQTVDMAVVHNGKLLLGCRHDGNYDWRFPGGFVEARSKKLEDDAIREVKEETGLNVFVKAYIGSTHIGDERYTKCSDSVKTAFFLMEISDGESGALGDDDLPVVKWVELEALNVENDKITEEHHVLVAMLKKHMGHV